MPVDNDVKNSSFYDFSDNPFAPSSAAYPGIEVSGAKGGWDGYRFTIFNRSLLINQQFQGIFVDGNTGWQWRFNNGVLDVGNVPWARLTNVPDASQNLEGLVSKEWAGGWTPTVRGSTTAGTATYSTRVGNYTRIGNLIRANFSIGLSALTGAAGDLVVSGLPIALPDVYVPGTAIIGKYGGINLQSGFTHLTAKIEPVGSISECVRFWRCGSGQAAATLTTAQVTFPFLIEGVAIYESELS